MTTSSEFSLIAQYFSSVKQATSKPATLGIGDDCALVHFSEKMHCAISTDMLVANQHFFADTDPYQLGHKALAVNLSDLAAMGAKPRAFTLALSLPNNDASWLATFSKGLFDLARTFDCELIGGDTTRGPLSICITIFGEVDPAHALLRKNARDGDDVWVSGELGNAAAGLAFLEKKIDVSKEAAQLFLRSLHTPTPRIALGQALQKHAHAAIDLSDGLVGDLPHILNASKLNARINLDALPRSAALSSLKPEQQLLLMLSGGDDYELCFTAPASQRQQIVQIGKQLNIRLSNIGQLEKIHPQAAPSIQWENANGNIVQLDLHGFDHFYAK